jgi:HSP20 family protein|uniref:Hsp20/alpha crystallin family protein n=1 Tax=Desulfobacca acetoxidans TaxID=60893 RepID=A0A7C3Z8Z7_9BACT
MHRLIKIRIIRDLEHLEERMRCWRDRLFPMADVEIPFRPAANLYETSAGLVLQVEIPGAAREDLSIDLAGQELIIRGRRRPAPPADTSRVLHYEITYGCFERSFHFPIAIDLEGVTASYEHGILEVQLPRHRPQARRIPVREIRDDQE